MSSYVSIRAEVLAKLSEHLAEIRERFGVEQIGIFGSVSRAEDTPESDVDVLYTFKKEYDTYDNYFDFSEYLEELFGRKVDLISPSLLKPRFRQQIFSDTVMCEYVEGTV